MTLTWTRRAVLGLAVALTAGSAFAQTQNPFVPQGQQFRDYREDMRQFVQGISDYTRGLIPAFKVVVQDATDLVVKANPEDDTEFFPAKTFMRAVDGVMERELNTYTSPAPPDVKAQAQRMANLKVAQDYGLQTFALEFADQPAAIDKAYQAGQAQGVVVYTAPSTALSELASYPKTPPNTTANTIFDITQAKNYAYLGNSQGFGTRADFVQAMRRTNYDLLVLDVFHGTEPLTRADVEMLKYKQIGAKRLVFAHVDIGYAASFQYYWQAGWGTGNPAFIQRPVKTDPDRYRVEYWQPEWQDVIFGNPNSYIYGVMDLGFDGVVLTGLDAWKVMETGEEDF